MGPDPIRIIKYPDNWIHIYKRLLVKIKQCFNMPNIILMIITHWYSTVPVFKLGVYCVFTWSTASIFELRLILKAIRIIGDPDSWSSDNRSSTVTTFIIDDFKIYRLKCDFFTIVKLYRFTFYLNLCLLSFCSFLYENYLSKCRSWVPSSLSDITSVLMC